MLGKEQISQLFEALNDKLAERGELGEVGIVGGAVMCLVYDTRKSTRDVDAIFKPAALIRTLCQQIATEQHLQADWLNDAAKDFVQGTFTRVAVLELTHLRVWAPDTNYMLAMKCISALWDSLDRDDVIFLIKRLKLRKKEDVFGIIERFYPKNMIPAKTSFFIEELFTEKKV